MGLVPPTPAEADALRAVLAGNGFTDTSLVEKLGAIKFPTRRTRTLPRLLRLTASGSAQETLARLFLFGVAVPEEAARAAFHPLPLETVTRLGLVTVREGNAAPAVALEPYQNLLLTFDLPERFVEGAASDVVMGVSVSSVDCAHFTVRRPVESLLDIGTGCGFQAFLGAAHAARVTAVDRCARAVEFARFNAALNAIGNVEIFEGDRFEPVAGRRFDQIVGNLPFVIGPGGRYLYRDGGRELDGFCRAVVREAPAYLEEGGLCQIMCEWPHIEGQDWRERLASWFEGTGCDAWVLKLAEADPLVYAENWVRETEREDAAELGRLFDAWAEYLESRRVERISTGLVAMRRASGPNWFHVEDWMDHLESPFGEGVARGMALCDFLHRGAGASAEGLLGARLAVSPEARLLAVNESSPQGWRLIDARLGIPTWPGHEGVLQPNLINLLGCLDGRRTLGEAVALLSQRLNGSYEQVATACLPAMRRLIAGGFVLPQDPE